MPARIIPDVYSEVRPRGLATSLPFGLNTVAVIGTAERGVLDDPTLITSKQDMYDAFGEPGEYRTTAVPEGSELSLSRAGALAFDGGTPQIYFTRIGSSNVAAATRYITADNAGVADGYCAALEAVSEGSWGNLISYKVETADGDTATDGHVAAIGATVGNIFDQAAADPGSYLFDTYDGTVTPVTTQFSFLRIPSADTFIAVASPSTRVELQRAAADNFQRTVFGVAHADCGFYKESGEVDPTDIFTTTGGELLTQSFWTLDGFPIAGAITRLKKGGTPSVGTLVLKLYLADSNGRPTGSALATSAGIDATAIGATYETAEFAFASTYNLQPQTYYCIEMSKSVNLDSGGTITWAVDHASIDTFTQGEANFFTGAAWNAITDGKDLLFHPVFDLAENDCVFIVNDWGTDFMGTETKKIIWSEVAGNVPTASTDTLYLTYETGQSMKVTIRYDTITETYNIVDGYDLINDVNDTLEGSALATADESAYGSGEDNPDYFPLQTTGWQYFGVGAGESAGSATAGHDGADISASDFSDGLDLLLNIDAHIIVCAGQYSPTIHGYLQTHCINASNDKMERVGVVGHRYGLTLSQVMSSNAAAGDKRIIFTSPGIITANHGTGEEETVSAAYAGSLLAGFMASVNPSVSSLNKTMGVGGLENEYTNAELEQLIKRKINPLKASRLGGYRWAYAATTDADTSWHEITTVRITDYATRGIRLACEGFIGQKNLISKRNSVKTSVTGFMQNMVADTMLDDESPYTVEVSATRQDRVQGIVRVDVSFRPVFAIKYVVVTEYVE